MKNYPPFGKGFDLRESKRGEAPLPKTSPSLIQGRGIKGIGYLNK